MNSEAPSNPVSLLRLGASTSLQTKVLSQRIIEAVDNGDISALEVIALLKAWETASEIIKPAIRAKAVVEAEQHPQGKLTLYGNQIETVEAGTKYDYAASKDPIWPQLDAIANTAIERRKEREAFLRTIKPGDITTAVDPESGEEVRLVPPPKTSTTTVKVTLK
jgi:hypothetical protein